MKNFSISELETLSATKAHTFRYGRKGILLLHLKEVQVIAGIIHYRKYNIF